ncbi:MAG: hypothetical protein ABSH20_12210 [Tepidisphaeraceae bacterium]
MKRLINLLAWTLALNFLAVAGGVGYLFQSGRLDKPKIYAIKDIVNPPPSAVAPATQPASTTQPVLKLDELLAQYAGRPPVEQLEYIRQAFDAQMVQLERTQKEMVALRAQAEAAQAAARREREAVELAQKKLDAKEKEALAQATDKGFQDSLALYASLPAKQTKALFMSLDVDKAVEYLQAMEPRAAARITKEFKTPEETERLKKILDRLRAPGTQAASSN